MIIVIVTEMDKFEILAANKQLTSAKIMQRSNVVIMPLVFASWAVGVYAEYEQSIALYGTFTILNGVIYINKYFVNRKTYDMFKLNPLPNFITQLFSHF